MLDKEHRVKEFVNDNFPMATLEETFSDHLVFRIPQLSVRSLGYCFTEIEKGIRVLEYINILIDNILIILFAN